jgi:hypothetical protein
MKQLVKTVMAIKIKTPILNLRIFFLPEWSGYTPIGPWTNP